MYFDHVQQEDGFGDEILNAFDVDLQHRFALGARDDCWGAGYRYTDIEETPSFYLTFNPETEDLHLENVFAQDDITLVRDRLHFTLGSKFEHNDLTGSEIEPSARLLWTPAGNQTVWAGGIARDPDTRTGSSQWPVQCGGGSFRAVSQPSHFGFDPGQSESSSGNPGGL